MDDAVEAATMQLVVFELAGEAYGVRIDQVREIIRVPAITEVPQTPEFVEGVINLRGGVIPVIDLRRRFGMGPWPEGAERRKIIVVEMAGKTLGIGVDGVSDVLQIDRSTIEPPSPYLVTVDSRYIVGLAKHRDDLIILLDLDAVLSLDERERLVEMEEAGHVGH